MQPSDEALSLKEKVRRLPHRPGVYLMKDAAGLVIYVGKAKDLKNRVSSYFRGGARHDAKVAAMVSLVRDFDIHEVRNETEALLLEGKLIKDRRPKYNILFRDDKQFLRVRVDVNAPIPRFRLVREKLPDNALYYGPFPHAPEVRRALHECRKRFGILVGDARPTDLGDGRWRLFDDARAEISGHPNEVTPEAYRARVEAACEWLEGRVRDGVATLKAEMAAAAGARDYERAAYLRDTVAALESVGEKARRFDRGDPLAARDDKAAVKALQAALGLEEPPRTMECFDISHISGTFCVAAMTYFRDGAPDKAEYRHFRIQSFTGNDDFRAMAEVVARRYSRLLEEAREFPRLLVIDGGLGQVRAAREAIEALGATPPPMIGLAKRDEHIIFPDGRPPLVLPKHDPALRLLQRIRDEAHRFSNNFNAELRSKKIRESVLDEVPGLGPKRRELLMEKFGSLPALKRATAERIAEVGGIGPKLAAEIRTLLDSLGG